MNNMLRFASVSEAATGLLLIVDPQLVVRLLFGIELGGSGGILGRMLGITLVAIGVAGWRHEVPGRQFSDGCCTPCLPPST